jgi:hypothetical protein
MADVPDTQDADFLTVLSSELIAAVMEEYFNRKMYRQKVKVVDLQPQGSGYAFSLAFVKDDPKLLHITPADVRHYDTAPLPKDMEEWNGQFVTAVDKLLSATNGRDAKGKFTRKAKVD